MSETITSVQSMPEILLGMIDAEIVKIREEDGRIILIPIKERRESPLRGMFAGKSKPLENGELHSERFSREKQLEKELEF